MIARLFLLTLLATAACASAQPQPQPTRQGRYNPQAGSATNRPDQERDIESLTEQLASLRQQITAIQNERSATKSYWWKGEQPPVWSNWALIIVAVGAGWVAWLAFTHEREAVMLTERADILFDGVSFKPNTNPAIINGDTEIKLFFKNHGPTRANNVRIAIDLLIPGATSKKPPNAPLLPTIVVGAHDQMSSSFPQLKMLFDEQIIATASKGDIPLRFKARVDYTDVFGKAHHTACSGTYYGLGGSRFITDDKHDAD